MTKSIRKVFNNFYSNEIAKKYPIRTAFNFIFLQAFHRITKRPLRFKLITGPKVLAYPHSPGISGFFYYGLPDHSEQQLLLDHIKKEDVFIDIGANIGGWSLLIAGKGARVVAFEPIPFSYTRLMANITLNPNISHLLEVYNLGLSSQSGKLYFTSDLDTGNTIISDPDTYSGKKIQVDVKQLDEYTTDLSPHFIKIDVEGHELEVIKGAFETLKSPTLKALIIETFRWANYAKPELREMEEILQNNGFIPCFYDVKTKKLIELKRRDRGGQNTIYARPGYF